MYRKLKYEEKKLSRRTQTKALRNNSMVGIILNLSLVYAGMLVTKK